ncbi:MAG: hypothetical protein A2804_01500 [Candidatus Pacebacteria bacterium RIFCSPHIGHO2_01_FULL_46_10]|nr:MAG: hypothetical protein A2804_01500 [Candidatus Pacebacteria bacterium RIFCSPHIGHO2_01_FULL_46_10]
MRFHITRLQLILFCTIIFLLPTNLFLKFVLPSSYVGGTLVDYLIPKFYLSDIPILLLFITWIYEKRNMVFSFRQLRALLHRHSCIALIAVFAIIHILTHLNTPSLPATMWFIVKLVEIWLLGTWITEHLPLMKKKAVFFVLIATILFQSSLALYQYRAQRSFFGYPFLGEAKLDHNPIIAKTKYSGSVRILPYGTTPHPNVLAGVIVGYLVLLWALFPKTRWTAVATIFGGMIVLLTESTTAVAAGILPVALFLYWKYVPYVKSKLPSPLFTIILFSILASALLFFFPQDTSFLRRKQLEIIAIRMFQAHPLFGAGLNQFTTQVERFGYVSSTVRFLQPAHNVALLWLAETGISGILFIALFVYIAHKTYSLRLPVAMFILFSLAPIFTLDHYLYSLQAGQLLSAILIGVSLKKK